MPSTGLTITGFPKVENEIPKYLKVDCDILIVPQGLLSKDYIEQFVVNGLTLNDCLFLSSEYNSSYKVLVL
jgi:hypothetical protein